MSETLKVSEREQKCLEVLTRHFQSEGNYIYFRTIVKETKLTLQQVRRSVRSLARKGLAEFQRGLMDEEGNVAGSGYCATEKGAAYISHCDLCDRINMYEYDGKKECELHYGQSKKTINLI